MEVLDSRPSSTPSGVPSPSESSLPPHMDLRGLSPSRKPVTHEGTPERLSPVKSPLEASPQFAPDEKEGEGGGGSAPCEPSAAYQFSMNDQLLQEEGSAPPRSVSPPGYPDAPCPLPQESSLSQTPPLDRDCGEREEVAVATAAVAAVEEETQQEDAKGELPPLDPPLMNPDQEERCGGPGPLSDPCQEEPLPPAIEEPSPQPVKEEDGPYVQAEREEEGHIENSMVPEHLDGGEADPRSIGEPTHLLSEPNSQLSGEESQQHSQQTMVEDPTHLPPLHEDPQPRLEDEHHHHHHLHHHLHNHHQQQHHPYGEGHLHDYSHSLLKLPLHHQDPLRDPQGLGHDFDDHPHSLGEHRHSQDPLGELPHHQLQPQTDRSHEGYWNMHLGMLRKVKSENKEWYEREGMLPDGLANAALKSSDPHDLYNYRIPSHPGLGPESPLSGSRPSPLPHGGLPFSQSPDQRQHQQHYQAYQNHSGLRDMSPMSPNYQAHHRNHLQTSQHHGASQLPGAQHPGLQHPSPHHPGNQHLQQQYAQQYGGQQAVNLQGHPGQPMPSPYAQGLMGPGMGGTGGHRVHDGREGREGDPYSFVDEYTGPPPRPVEEILGHAQPKRRGRKPKHIKLMENGGDPLAIAAAQAAHEAKKRKWRQMGPDGKPLPLPVKPRKRIDRFDGISEDELSKKVLPDHLGPNLDIVIIGINPGLFAAYKGHHYAGPGNHFWKCLYLSGLIPEPLTSDDDHQLLDHGIGFTNIVARTTRGSADLTRKEIKEGQDMYIDTEFFNFNLEIDSLRVIPQLSFLCGGGQILLAKLQRFQPRVAVFNGKGIYEIFSGKKEFTFGRQPEKIEGTHTHVWVMPSSSARCAQLPRALDKVPFYTALRKFRDFLKGTITELTEEEITFSCNRSSKHFKECEKLEGSFEDELSEPFLDESIKEDLDSSRFESDLDSEEISRSISQSLYNLSGMTREQLEALDCPTIPIRKKRGRPKKAPDDPNAPPRPKPRNYPTELMLCNGEEPPRKKRGRPKKVLEDGTIPPPKRPGRKPKALKEMLAAQQGAIPGAPGIHPNPHSQMGMGHLNGMMSPTGYNSNPSGPPFSPQFGGHQVPSHPGEMISPGDPSHGLNALPGIPGGHNAMHGPHGALHSGSGLPSLHSGGTLTQPGCHTPNSSSGSHNSLPARGPTPQGFGQSPGYSPSPVPSQMHSMGSTFNHPSEKSDLQLEEERQLGLSPIPGSPVMAQPDFEPPTSLPEGEPLIGEGREGPPVQAQYSDPGTPAEESPTPYQGYSSYPPPSTSCSPTYNTSVAPSPSFPPGVSHSPSYSPSVSCSPSYTPHNTQSPSYPPKSTQSPSPYPQRSPSYPPPPNQSPSFPSVTHSPSFPPTTTHSPSYHSNMTHSPSYSTLTRSPSYPANLTHSPSYPANMTHSPSYPTTTSQSPSYRPPTSNSPSFPPLNKPLAPGVHSPQMKSDVSSKSLSGLESLVDQIPSLSETEGGALSNGPCSNPTTPGPPADPFSPGHAGPQSSSSFQSFAGGGSTPFSAPHYGSPQPSNPYSPQYTSNSTNLSTNFSVSSLAGGGGTGGGGLAVPPSAPFEGAPGGVGGTCTAVPSSSSSTSACSTAISSSATSSSFSVASLTGDSPTPTPSMYSNSYSPVQPGHSPQSYDVMGSSILPPTPPMGPSFMSSSNMGGLPSSMSMSGAQLPYPYPQYGESGPGGYTGPGHSFPYSGSPGFHVPSPRFPYPSPYATGPYSRGYSQNSVLERIKQTGMGMGFGGF